MQLHQCSPTYFLAPLEPDPPPPPGPRDHPQVGKQLQQQHRARANLLSVRCRAEVMTDRRQRRFPCFVFRFEPLISLIRIIRKASVSAEIELHLLITMVSKFRTNQGFFSRWLEKLMRLLLLIAAFIVTLAAWP